MCLSCKDSMQLAPWKVHTDTSEHYKIFQIVRGYSTGVYNKDETRKKLKNVDLSDLNTFRPRIREIIEDILKEPAARVVKKNEIAEKLAVDKIDKAETEKGDNKGIVVESNVVVEDVKTTTGVSRKRNNKVEAE